MNTHIIGMKCPFCGAPLFPKEGSRSCICEYCDQPVRIETGAGRSVDEIRGRQAEPAREQYTDAGHRRQEDDVSRDEQARWQKTLRTWLIILAVAFVLRMAWSDSYGFLGRMTGGIWDAALIFGGIAVYLSRPKKKNSMSRTAGKPAGSRPQAAYSTYERPREPASPKDKAVALLLCIFGGYFGLHYFYVGKYVKGIIYILTFGLFMIGWFVDIFRIAIGAFKDSNGLRLI